MSSTAHLEGPLVGSASERPVPRSAVAGWVLYDLANTLFSMGVISLYFSLWIRDEVGPARADAVYGVITSISMALIFFAAPLLGAMSDGASRRMPFLVVATLGCVLLTATLGRFGYWFTVLGFVFANVAYQAGLQFYDSLLPEVSTEQNRGKIGGFGVGVGYLGSYIAVAIGLLLGTDDKSLLFTIIAVAFTLFSLPCFLLVRERRRVPVGDLSLGSLAGAVRRTIRTLTSSDRYPGLRRFLVGRALYTDAINTVIGVMALYATNVAVASGYTEAEGQRQAQLILLSAVTFAVIGGFAWGSIADRVGPKRALDLVLTVWMGIFLGAATIGIAGLPLWTLYVTAAFAGFAMGGVWAADRPLMLRLTPPDRVGEFYGLYGMVGRFSAITGPVLWAAVNALTITTLGLEPRVGQGVAVLSLLAFILVSYRVLRPVSDAPRTWAVHEPP